MHAVVVWDPTGEHRQGDVVEGQRRIMALGGSKVVLLPVDPEIVGEPCAVSGYVQRHFGARGQPMNRMQGERGPSAFLYLHPEKHYLHWAARVAPLEMGAEAKGMLRISADSAQPGQSAFGGLASGSKGCDIGGEPDEYGGWTIGGSVNVSVTKPGTFGVCLYGVCRGLGVQWLALTQSSGTL